MIPYWLVWIGGTAVILTMINLSEIFIAWLVARRRVRGFTALKKYFEQTKDNPDA